MSLARRADEWIAARSRWQVLGLAVASGGVAAAGQVPVSLPWLALFAFAGLFALMLRADNPRQAAVTGWLGGTGYFAVSLHWIVEPFLVDIARHGWMAPFALVLLSIGLALFWGLAFGLSHWLGRGVVSRAAAVVVLLTAAEVLRSYAFTGFPWALIGYIWTQSPQAQLGAVIGPHGITFMTLLAVACSTVLLRRGPVWALAPVPVLVAFGLWGASLVSPAIAPGAPVIRMVQPNVPQRDKWNRDLAPEFFRRQLDLTSAVDGPRPDLVVWPETAIPYWLGNAGDALAVIGSAAQGAPVAFGVLREEGVLAYNSLAVIDPAGAVTQLYDKYHLVPFGEYIPQGAILSRLGIGSFAQAEGYGFSAGPGAELLDLGTLGRVLPLICYEAIFPQDVNAAPARPDWMLQVTNDAWFGRLAGPFQHLAQARMRAIEQGLPMVRVANTGVSAMIDARGRVTGSLALNVAGKLDRPLPPALPATYYSRTGDAPLILLLILGALGLLGVRFRFND
ncbi:apolipoprotein N-acyltransferase [Pseudogemmobacter sp. W21_MBD1_M6]|uniref:apolipoprotein N-acyltransferase n=1 Tax=Pseudogemmobacter sp. W21_MBD1_M6 TaxID=3240271 RepID=UPI003F987901